MFSGLGSAGLLGMSQYDYLNQQAMNQQAAYWAANQGQAANQCAPTASTPDERLLVLLTEE
ncbi:hypothetical protein [Paraburkholderia sp. SIMBA_054]|uniref:hypothetical protein n=1 Tax=Paraburkholderia sp. SIMBA_054 TaxID=3085795 RepID=UPI00397C8626